MWAHQLSPDLKTTVGEPFMLFKASENQFAGELNIGTGNYVTDGPYLYREGGKVKMIWSSYSNKKYLILTAETDNIRGKWVQGKAQFNFDGGHAMLFHTLNGERKISFHAPNTTDCERFEYCDF